MDGDEEPVGDMDRSEDVAQLVRPDPIEVQEPLQDASDALDGVGMEVLR